MNLIVKDRMFAGVFPILFMEGLILIFSVSELLISDKLIWVRNSLGFIGEKVLLIFNLLNSVFFVQSRIVKHGCTNTELTVLCH